MKLHIKLYIKFILFVLVLALACPFFLNGSNGLPLMTFDRLKWADIDMHGFDSNTSLVDKIKNMFSTMVISGKNMAGQSARTGIIYRWKNQYGFWTYSDIPHRMCEVVQIKSCENVLHYDPISRQSLKAASSEEKDGGPSVDFPWPMTISPAETLKLIEDAKNLKQMLNARADTQAIPE